jgi:2-oxoglutarate dehydrogenase E2 component (dihydrolipoamide succinyltransferase)
MAIVDLVMPKLGESIMEATILKWMKQPGDTVKMDETVLEIATDKVDSEVPSTTAGVIEEILYQVNDVVPIGTVIARIKTSTSENVGTKPFVNAPNKESANQHFERAEVVEPVQRPSSGMSAGSMGQQQTSNGRFYSPLVLNIAASEGISMSELENISGTGNEGRVTKKDILQYVSDRKAGKAMSHEPRAASHKEVTIHHESPSLGAHSSQLTAYTGGNVEIIEMDRMRKLIAEHMVRSKQISPHVTSFTEADVTNMGDVAQ